MPASQPSKTVSTQLAAMPLVKAGWQSLRQAWRPVLIAFGIVFVVTLIVSLVGGQLFSDSFLEPIFSIASMLLSLFLTAGLIMVSLKIVRGQETKPIDLFSQKENFVTFVLAELAYGLLVALGFILFIVPGIYFVLKYWLVPYLVVDKKMSFSQAFSTSAQKTSGKFKAMLSFFVLVIALNVLGYIPFGLGLIVTAPLSFLAQAHLYRLLMDEV